VIIAQGQLLIEVGNTSVAYGTLTSANIAASAAVSASYCTIGSDCSVANNIVRLTVAAGSTANTWIANDANPGNTRGNYTLTVEAPILTSANSSTGGFLNVGSYSFTPSSDVVTNPGYQTNYATSYPVITIPGAINVTPLTLSINSPSPSKVYDATNAIVAKTLTASNVIADDRLTIRGSGTYDTVNAGTGLSYTLNGISITGADSANYAFAGNVTGSNGEITKAELTISGATAANKTYDGTTAASFSGGTLNGLVSLDSANVTLTQAGTFSQINVGIRL
jgi:hypothetical protein